MKISVFIILIFLFIVVSSYRGYHEAVGIPKARQLMAIEGPGLRIVGRSQVSAISAYPYQAGIVATLTTGWTSICGGALLSNTRVVTAAHCWWDGESQARQFVVVLGSLTIFSGGTRITTSDVTMHMSWNTQEITHDIAMVKITSVGYSSFLLVNVDSTVVKTSGGLRRYTEKFCNTSLRNTANSQDIPQGPDATAFTDCRSEEQKLVEIALPEKYYY